jgi:hypothetical protein
MRYLPTIQRPCICAHTSAHQDEAIDHTRQGDTLGVYTACSRPTTRHRSVRLSPEISHAMISRLISGGARQISPLQQPPSTK